MNCWDGSQNTLQTTITGKKATGNRECVDGWIKQYIKVK